MTASEKQVLLERIENFINSQDRFFPEAELVKELGLFLSISQMEEFGVESILITHDNLIGPKKNERLFASKRFYDELITEIIFSILSNNKSPMPLEQLRSLLRLHMATYLGLNQNEISLIDLVKLETILSSDGRFVISHKSAFEYGKNNYVALGVWEAKLYRTKSFVFEIIRTLGPDRVMPVKSLLFKLNLSKTNFGFAKPYSIETILKLMDIEGAIFTIEGELLKATAMEERIVLKLNGKMLIKDFKPQEDVPGLLVFSFIGEDFPISEAREYVNLRPAVYFAQVEYLEFSYSKILKSFVSLIASISGSSIGDAYDWVLQNFAVSFVIEEPDFLKLNFDKLMSNYSPILNLDRNPGNLFRGIIEEKIREYENEQRTKN